MSWNKKLSRPLVVKDGKRLETLSDVRAVFLDRLGNVTHSYPIAYAGELLLKAAETGKRADIEAATDQIERVLSTCGSCDAPTPPRRGHGDPWGLLSDGITGLLVGNKPPP